VSTPVAQAIGVSVAKPGQEPRLEIIDALISSAGLVGQPTRCCSTWLADQSGCMAAPALHYFP
jgi:hypothetical protein